MNENFLDLAAGATEIREAAFCNCTSLKSVTIPDYVTKIGARSFENCINLTDIVISGGVREIGKKAFSGCGILCVTVLCKTPAVLREQAFGRLGTDVKIHVPVCTEEIYKTVEGWYEYADHIIGDLKYEVRDGKEMMFIDSGKRRYQVGNERLEKTEKVSLKNL